MIWCAVAVCVLVSFLFSGIEAGLLSVNRIRLKHRVKLRDRAALVLDCLLAEPERLLVTVLVVTNLMNIFALTLTTQELVHWLGPRGYWIALLAALPVYLLGLELLPKSLFRRFPYRALAALATPLRLADLLLSPLHFAGGGLMRVMFHERPAEQQKLFVAREDFKYLTIESERTGALGHAERQMIHNVVDFRAVTAQQVMLPMENVRTIPRRRCWRTAGAQQGGAYRALAGGGWQWCGGGSGAGLRHRAGRAERHRESYQRRIVKVLPQESAYSLLTKRAAR